MNRFTSWGREADDRWNAFRDAVRAGVDPEQAARAAGLVAEPVDPAERGHADPPQRAGADREEGPMADHFKTSAQKAAEGRKRGRNDERDHPETRYRIKARSRVPLIDAGTLHTGEVTGRAGKRALVRDLEKQGYEVVKVESKKPGGIFWW